MRWWWLLSAVARGALTVHSLGEPRGLPTAEEGSPRDSVVDGLLGFVRGAPVLLKIWFLATFCVSFP